MAFFFQQAPLVGWLGESGGGCARQSVVRVHMYPSAWHIKSHFCACVPSDVPVCVVANTHACTHTCKHEHVHMWACESWPAGTHTRTRISFTRRSQTHPHTHPLSHVVAHVQWVLCWHNHAYTCCSTLARMSVDEWSCWIHRFSLRCVLTVCEQHQRGDTR